MGIIRKYAFVLALAVAVIYAYAPLSLEDVAKLRWLDDINVIVNKSLAPAKPEVGVSAVDPIAAANVDEDVDYRIAQRTKSTEGWRSFLAAHPDGPHAQSARAAVDKLIPAGDASRAGRSCASLTWWGVGRENSERGRLSGPAFPTVRSPCLR